MSDLAAACHQSPTWSAIDQPSQSQQMKAKCRCDQPFVFGCALLAGRAEQMKAKCRCDQPFVFGCRALGARLPCSSDGGSKQPGGTHD